MPKSMLRLALVEPSEERQFQGVRLVKNAPDSNIPPTFQLFQQQLALALNIAVEHVPFIGQCVEVKDKIWQGAIERAIGSNRLRIVIPPKHFRVALKWVNQRNNQLHVRLLNSQDYEQPQTARSALRR